MAVFSKFRNTKGFGARPSRLLILTLSATALITFSPSRCWSLGSAKQPHNSMEMSQQVLKEALGNQFCDANLNMMAAGSAPESASANAASDDSFKCFRDPDLLKSLNFMERERRTIIKLCANADVDASARALALYHIGTLFRHAQDFYSGSNYVELKVSELTANGKEVTPEMLYGLDLVDWTSLLTMLRKGERTTIKVQDAGNADSNSAEAKRSVGGVTYFSITRELSVRETQRQWKLLESLIRAQFKQNGGTILTSLQKTGLPKDVFEEVVKHGDTASF